MNIEKFVFLYCVKLCHLNRDDLENRNILIYYLLLFNSLFHFNIIFGYFNLQEVDLNTYLCAENRMNTFFLGIFVTFKQWNDRVIVIYKSKHNDFQQNKLIYQWK